MKYHIFLQFFIKSAHYFLAGVVETVLILVPSHLAFLRGIKRYNTCLFLVIFCLALNNMPWAFLWFWCVCFSFCFFKLAMFGKKLKCSSQGGRPGQSACDLYLLTNWVYSFFWLMCWNLVTHATKQTDSERTDTAADGETTATEVCSVFITLLCIPSDIRFCMLVLCACLFRATVTIYRGGGIDTLGKCSSIHGSWPNHKPN